MPDWLKIAYPIACWVVLMDFFSRTAHRMANRSNSKSGVGPRATDGERIAALSKGSRPLTRSLITAATIGSSSVVKGGLYPATCQEAPLVNTTSSGGVVVHCFSSARVRIFCTSGHGKKNFRNKISDRTHRKLGPPESRRESALPQQLRCGTTKQTNSESPSSFIN